MKVTGYQLRAAISEWKDERDTAESHFEGSKYRFPDEDKPSPAAVMDRRKAAETAIARLQVGQMRYNLAVEVKVHGVGPMTLAEAIKRRGGVSRMEGDWKKAAQAKKDRWDMDRVPTREEGTTHAEPVMTSDEYLRCAKHNARLASAYREAIQVGNAAEIEIEGLEPSLFPALAE